METKADVRAVQDVIKKHVVALNKNRTKLETDWRLERNALTKQALLSIRRYEKIKRKNLAQIRACLLAPELQDNIFSIFKGQATRIGRYFFLNIYSIRRFQANASQASDARLVLTWDICKAKADFMIMRNDPRELSSGLYKRTTIASLRSLLKGALLCDKGRVIEAIRKYSEPYFLDCLEKADMLSSPAVFFEFLMKTYPPSQIIPFSKRCQETIDLKGERQASMGGKKSDFLETHEFLLDEGFPDRQRIIIDISEHGIDNEAEYVERSIGWFRNEYRWMDRSESLCDMSDEPSEIRWSYPGHD